MKSRYLKKHPYYTITVIYNTHLSKYANKGHKQF